MSISVLTENVQSSSCIGLRTRATKDSMSATVNFRYQGQCQNAKLNAAQPMLCKRQCYDFMGKMIQWNIDGELDHIPKMLGLFDGGEALPR